MLPKLDVPVYEIKLISTGKTVRYRPFLVKEQKLLLMASQSEDAKETLKSIRQILTNCIIDEIDINSLPTFDLEWLFLNLRAKSVEEVVQLRYKCNNTVKNENDEDVTCKGVVEYDLNIAEIQPTKNPEHKDTFQLNDNLGIKFKYPTVELIEKYEDREESEVMLEVLVDCIEMIFDKDQIYYTKDVPREELKEFVDNFQQKDLEKFKLFFETAPEIKKELDFQCPKCGYKEKLTVKGLQNFFA